MSTSSYIDKPHVFLDRNKSSIDHHASERERRSCLEESSKNLPMRHSQCPTESREQNSGRAQNSVAQKNKSDLPVTQGHQQTELVTATKNNHHQQRTIWPRSTSDNTTDNHSSPKKTIQMTLPASQKRFPGATSNGQEEQFHQQDIIQTLTSGILFGLTPDEPPTTMHIPSHSVVATTTEKEQKRQPQNHDLVPTMEPEVDSRDTESSGASKLPLHRMLEVESPITVEVHLEKIGDQQTTIGNRIRVPSQSHKELPPTSSPTSSNTTTPPRSQGRTSTSGKVRTSSRKYKKLTLSAYRKPEETVRLTECDASRLLENEYSLRAPGCRIIGHGAFSTVRSALRITDGTKVAIKSISKFDALRARRLRRPKGSKHMDEWEIMKLLRNNPYILTLYDVFETDEEIHLVTEFCRGGELFDAIKRKSTQLSSFRRGTFSESQSARITNQILKALVELHALGIVHRDIKAENILLRNCDESDIQVKLCDFGMARLHQRYERSFPEVSSDGEVSPSTPGLLFGNAISAPPEGFHGSCIGPATDIFSLGVTVYILLCGYPPVFCENVVEFPDAYWGDISEDAKDVVRSMLHHDPKQRISASAALKNAWIRQENTRIRRGSISGNLELVRARLVRSLGEAAGCSPKGASKRRFNPSINSPNKRSRISSLDLSLSALYSCSEKRDVRVIEERVESRAIGGEERGERMACSLL